MVIEEDTLVIVIVIEEVMEAITVMRAMFIENICVVIIPVTKQFIATTIMVMNKINVLQYAPPLYLCSSLFCPPTTHFPFSLSLPIYQVSLLNISNEVFCLPFSKPIYSAFEKSNSEVSALSKEE
uniref:Uncharacterized protein n=1 Tax=Octopus bimaculoides TaxID=37653 RepID=A0A0L8G3Z4_OCTBM